MKIGDSILVEIIEQKSPDKYRVKQLNQANLGVLSILGKLKFHKEGVVKAWILDVDRRNNIFYCGNSYFGKYSISDNISNKYIAILNRLFHEPKEITDTDVSTLKGMINRCLKRDQWDWYTTYQFLGYPDHRLLRTFVTDCVNLRNELRSNDRTNLKTFTAKYSFILSSIYFHLTQESTNIEKDIDLQYLKISPEIWEQLDISSKDNLRLIFCHINTQSIFLLMHLFVVLEHEFRSNLIQPFLDKYKISSINSTNKRYERLHNILNKKEKMTLGSIFHLGQMIGNPHAIQASQLIKEFHDYLGEHQSAFKLICEKISSYNCGQYNLVNLRNGIAHGDPDITQHISIETFKQLYDVCLTGENSIIQSIVKLSFK